MEKYGLSNIVVTAQEQAVDHRYGGFPNTKEYNNNTKCSAIIRLFSRFVGPDDISMHKFLIFSKFKLMELDLVWPAIRPGEASIIDTLGAQKWKILPALYPSYCRSHPSGTLEEATGAIYEVARTQVSSQ